MPTTLHRRQDAVSRAIEDRLVRLDLDNVFNPSVAALPDGRTLLAVRAHGPDATPPFHAFLLAVGDDAVTSLTDHAAAHGVGPVADPKLFRVGDDCWVTFNTGSPTGVPNDVYVMPVTPHPGRPLRCVLAPRQRIEKNCGFHAGPDGRLAAVYALTPLQRLAETARDADTVTFRPVDGGAPASVDVVGGLSLGTPLLPDGHGGLVGVAHERRVLRWGRTYWGRGVRVHGDRVDVLTGPLLHRWRDAVVPARVRHNPNLWTATYFAGLLRTDTGWVVTYGVNDVEAHAAPLPELGPPAAGHRTT